MNTNLTCFDFDGAAVRVERREIDRETLSKRIKEVVARSAGKPLVDGKLTAEALAEHFFKGSFELDVAEASALLLGDDLDHGGDDSRNGASKAVFQGSGVIGDHGTGGDGDFAGGIFLDGKAEGDHAGK